MSNLTCERNYLTNLWKCHDTYTHSTSAMSNNLLDAFIFGRLWYLSDKYTTFWIPDWIMSLAHSLHGKRATYIVHPFTLDEFLFNIAFISAWQTRLRRNSGSAISCVFNNALISITRGVYTLRLAHQNKPQHVLLSVMSLNLQYYSKEMIHLFFLHSVTRT